VIPGVLTPHIATVAQHSSLASPTSKEIRIDSYTQELSIKPVIFLFRDRVSYPHKI